MPAPAPPLVVIAHGTADEQGRAVIEHIAGRASTALGQPSRVGYVDVCTPTAADALRGLHDAVAVPLFLATGFHVRTDVPAAVADAPGAVATAAIGSGQPIIEALLDRVREVEPHPDGVVLTGAGSSDAEARSEVIAAAALLQARLGVPVRHAFLSASGPTLEEAYATLTGQVVVAAHLLAPGYFHRVLVTKGEKLGAPVTAPIGDHPQVAATVVERYRQATSD